MLEILMKHNTAFWYVKHKNKIKFPMKKLNKFLADIEKTLLRHLINLYPLS